MKRESVLWAAMALITVGAIGLAWCQIHTAAVLP